MSASRTLGVIGSGMMAEALVRGWLGAGRFAPEDVLAADPDERRRSLFRSDLGVAVSADNAEAASYADVLLIAVKPQVLPGVCGAVGGAARPDALVLSIAAGVALSTLESFFGDRPIVRTMPSILHAVQAGVAAICPNRRCSAEQAEWTLDLFRTIGVAEVVEERLMDAVTGLSGSGPAFVAAFLEAMSDGGVAAGLPRPLATAFAAQTALGTAKWVLQGQRPGELKERVTSPGGTTIAGLRAAEARGFRSAVIEAVVAAAERSRELGRPGPAEGKS